MNAAPARIDSATHGPLRPWRSYSWILWLVFGLVVLVLTANLALESDWITSRLTQWAQERLSERVGGAVRLKKAHLRLFPTVLFLEEFSLPPAVEIRRVRIQLSPWSLLTRSLFIGSVLLEEPSIKIPSAGVAFPGPHGPEGKARKEGQDPFLIIRSVSVRDGRLTYEGTGAIISLQLSALNGQVDPDLFMRRFSVKLSAGSSMLQSKGQLFQFTRIEAKGEVNPDRVEIKKLEASLPEGTLYTNGTIGISDDPSFDLFVRANLPLKVIARSVSFGHFLSGEASLQMQVGGSAENPTAQGRGIFTDITVDSMPFGTFSSEIRISEDRLSLTSLRGEMFSGKVRGEAGISYLSEQYSLALQFEGLQPHAFIRTLIPSRWVREGTVGGEVHLAGRGTDPSFLVGGGALRVDFAAPNAPSSPSPDGARPVGGEGLGLEALNLLETGEVAWSVNQGSLSIESAQIRLPGSTLSLRGQGTLHRLDGAATLESKDFRRLLAPFSIPVEGGGIVSVDLSVAPGHLRAFGKVLLQRGRFRHLPIGEASLPFQFDGKDLTLSEGILRQENGIYRISGKVGPVSLARAEGSAPIEGDLSVQVENADVHQILDFFVPDLPLTASANGRLRLSGSVAAPRVTATLELGKGSLYGQPFDEARVSMQITDRLVHFSAVEMARGNGRAEGSGQVGFQGSFQGKIRSTGFPLQEIRWIELGAPPLSGILSGEITGQGSFSQPRLAFSLRVANARYGENEIGSGVVEGGLDRERVSFHGDFSGIRADGVLNLQRPYPYRMKASFERFKADPFLRSFSVGPWGKVALTLSGGIEAEGEGESFSESHVRFLFSEVSADVLGYPIGNDGEIQVEMTRGDVHLNQFRLKGEETALSVSGGVKLFKEFDLYVNGEAGLRLLGLLTRGITYGKGKAYLVLKISDRWDDPKLRGGLTVQDGVIRHGAVAAPLNVTELSIFFNEKQLLLESFQANLGRGTISGSGKIDVERFEPKQFGFFLEVNDLRMNPIDGFSSSISGTLFYQGNPKFQELKGDVQIVQALYNKRLDLKSWLLEFKKKEQQASSIPPQTALEVPLGRTTKVNVHVSGKENIWIDNNVAKIPIEVDVFLRGTLEHPLISGRADASRGTFRFRTNDFTIGSASVDLLNPERIDPQFNLKAATQVKALAAYTFAPTTYTIELGLTGNFDRFNLVLSSTPSLSEPDILALLAVGKTTDEIQTGGKVGGEAASFVVSQFLEESVTGLTSGAIDQFQVGSYTDPTRGSSGQEVTIGKRLMEDRLVVTYKTTLDPSQEQLVRMEYEVSKNISLVGEDKSGRIGGDIKFRFEFH